ncbi:glycosyltransferase [Labrys wisconsinensis]|uniref:Ceramide glucosyltransferase n=1 Tax=Labrys wisconsinensis TaxID=425677 RepID=A0ABU0IZ19_9HYPH|nr:glycosyltransferase [Labrys wisconsinensis]MDQ0467260.1 ceramide glucosyltransferase [Labrys wisconsinensis]
MTIVFDLAALWWCAIIAVLVGSAILALVQPVLARRRARNAQMPPISVLVPLKRDLPGLAAATHSIFAQRYPAFDVTFSAAEESSSAITTVLQAATTCPVVVRRTRSQPGAINPKVANLIDPIATASYDHVLLKDAGTRLAPGTLRSMMRSHGPGVGLVCAVPVATDAAGFVADVEQAVINTHGARFLLAASALRLDIGIGAAMLVERGDLAKAKGVEAMAASIADDHALAKAMRAIGLRTAFADTTVDQALGRRSLKAFLERHRRWILCRRQEAPAAYFAELFVGAAAGCIAGALAAPAFGLSPWTMVGATLAAWLVVETALALIKRWPVTPVMPLAILARELVLPGLWWSVLPFRRRGEEEPLEPRVRFAPGHHPAP